MSGVAFQVKPESPRRQVGGRTVFFCCDGCANYFTGHRDSVIRRRRLDAPAPTI